MLWSSLATVAKDAMTSSKMVDIATVRSQDGDRCQRSNGNMQMITALSGMTGMWG